jgi:hypothetical protein
LERDREEEKVTVVEGLGQGGNSDTLAPFDAEMPRYAEKVLRCAEMMLRCRKVLKGAQKMLKYGG